MKTILGVVFILLASPVHAIVVTGEASSFELAQQQAFKQAIDHEVGVIVDTERFMVDREIIHNQILTYSAGYITDYTIISHTITEPEGPEGKHIVTMDVTVASSVLKDFLLTHAESITQFNGANIKMQIDYYRRGLVDGDRLVNNTLKYFPSEAIQVDASDYNIVLDENRRMYLEIPYALSWDHGYLDSLYELLSLFAIDGRSTIFFDFGNKNVLYFHDLVLMKNIKNRMTRVDFIEIKITNLRNEPLLNTCVQNIFWRNGVGWDGRSTLYAHKGDGVKVNDRRVENYVSIPISNEIYKTLEDMSQIELRVSAGKDCPS